MSLPCCSFRLVGVCRRCCAERGRVLTGWELPAWLTDWLTVFVCTVNGPFLSHPLCAPSCPVCRAVIHSLVVVVDSRKNVTRRFMAVRHRHSTSPFSAAGFYRSQRRVDRWRKESGYYVRGKKFLFITTTTTFSVCRCWQRKSFGGVTIISSSRRKWNEIHCMERQPSWYKWWAGGGVGKVEKDRRGDEEEYIEKS